MATRKFFSDGFTNQSKDQNLLDSLIRETIEINGTDLYYLPRTLVNKDELLGEDTLSIFKKAFIVEMYFADSMGFGPEGEMMNKFGFGQEKSITLNVSMTKFRELTNKDKPVAGDWIYHPVTNALFEIAFVNDGGRNQFIFGNNDKYFHTLYCNLVQYSNERIQTGEGIIDQIAEKLQITNDSNGLKNDYTATNDKIVDLDDPFKDFSESSPFGNY